MPQGSGFLRLAFAAPLHFLFSTWNGAFLSHPIWLLGLVGLVPRSSPPTRIDTPLRVGLLSAIGAEIACSMLVQDWWAGGAFGQRRLVPVLPFMGVGLAVLLSRIRPTLVPRARRLLVGLLALAISWNVLGLLPAPRWLDPVQPRGSEVVRDPPGLRRLGVREVVLRLAARTGGAGLLVTGRASGSAVS